MEFVTVAGDWVYVTLDVFSAGDAIRALDNAGNIIIQVVPINRTNGTNALLVRTGSDVKLPAPVSTGPDVRMTR